MTTPADMTDTTARRYSESDSAAFYAAGYWLSGSLADLVQEQAGTWTSKVFVFDSTTEITYEQLHRQSVQLAAGLARDGIRRGDKVAVQLPNWAEFTLVTVALARIGAVLVPIMPVYRDRDVDYVLGHSEVRAVITCEEFKGFGYAEMFLRLAAERGIDRVYSVRASSECSLTPLSTRIVDEPLDALNLELGPAAGPDDDFAIVYTSGTTSRPKGCLHTFNTYRASATAIAQSVNYTDRDIQLGPSPISHTTGLVTSFVLPLVAGASSHLVESWEPSDGLDRIRRYKCTATVTATAFLQMLLGAYDPAVHDASSMRLWISAGAPVPGSVVRASRTALPDCRVLSLYGRSENLLTTMCTMADDPERAVTSDGSAVHGASVRIVDEAGLEVPRGTEGDIAYKGPSHMLEYYRDPEQTAELFTTDGYSRSGDLGRMDADGYVRVTGRLKDIVIRGGLNISARELEDLLIELPSVSSIAIVGMPDTRLGERVCAYVVAAPAQPAPTLDDVVAHLTMHRVAKPKLPERLELRTELPMTATGKIQKHLLRADIARVIET